MEEIDEVCDQLKIVNRRREYTVSKKFICSIVPYFEKMFCCDLLESKENKVELDFDEHVFDAILDWVHSGSFITKMDYVISFYDAADYLMINDGLLEPCLSYFHENFSVEQLPVILSQVTKLSKLLSSELIENLICRHFLMIVNTNAFLDYSVETLEAIFRLDLMVYSEFQIFESIIKWVNKKFDRRKQYFLKMLTCVRWQYMTSNDLIEVENNALIRRLSVPASVYSFRNDYEFDRSEQNFLVSILQKGDIMLQIKAFDDEFFCFTIGDFTQDDSMSLEFVHSEHVSDILFESGTKGIRVNWMKKTFRWLEFKVAGETYYSNLIKFLVEFSLLKSNCYLEDKKEVADSVSYEESLLLESNGEFIAIGKTKDEKKWFGYFPVLRNSSFNNFKDHEHSFHATVSDNVVYILTKDLEFIQFNYVTRSFKKSEPFKDKGYDFNDLILTSHPTGDNKIFLVCKSSGKVNFFSTYENDWSEFYRVLYVNLTANATIPVTKLIAFTSAFLSIKQIKPLYKQTLI